jgi:hypothetical protein
MMKLLDESGLQQLVDLLADDLALFLIEAAQALLHRLEPAQISKACSVTSLGMFGISKGLHAKMSMFARRKSTSTVSYLGSRVALMLNTFPFGSVGSRGMSLTSSVQTIEVRRQGRRLQDGFSVLDALHVALVGVLVGGPDSYDTVGARHIELEVGVIGDHHEPGIAWVPKDGVVCSMESNHFKNKSLFPEVGRSAETDKQVDPPDGLCSLP